MISIKLPDGSKKEVQSGVSIADFIKENIGEGLFRAAVAAKINGETTDLATTLTTDCELTVLTFKDDEGKQVFWHSAAHVLAIAATRLFPHVKLTIGPSIDEGFYYDFHMDRPFTDEDIISLQTEMKKIVKEDMPFVKEEINYEKAKDLFTDNIFKLEIIEEYKNDGLSLYKNGDFFDLCKGPHVFSTGRIKAFKLTKYSGAYWRGKSENEQLQRIYGIAYPSKDDLKVYVQRIEEAKKRDHRKITQELDLCMLHEYAPGSPFFLPNGTIIYNALVDFVRSEYKTRGYQEVITPQMFNKKLWEQSGHWEHYKDDMFILNVEGQEHSLKPMNCPSHCLIYNRSKKSYRELPLRLADFGNLHRNELSGTLSGLTRVRKFAQDDAHIFCRFDQIQDEVASVLDFIKDVWIDIFGFKLTFYLSTRPESKLGDDELWDKSEKMLADALTSKGIDFSIKEGDGAFYGPKIDIDLEDALGRKWQCPTCQLDFNLPKRFKCTYEGSDGKEHEAVMIHRAVLGSLERFFGIMVEHYAGRFPMWLSPVQVKLLPIADRHAEYAKSVAQKMEDAGLRTSVDERPLTTSKKVREAQLSRVNYIIVVGDSEIEKQSVNVRTRDEEVLGEKPVDEFIHSLVEEVKLKK